MNLPRLGVVYDPVDPRAGARPEPAAVSARWSFARGEVQREGIRVQLVDRERILATATAHFEDARPLCAGIAEQQHPAQRNG
jgi:hypothetical protein